MTEPRNPNPPRGIEAMAAASRAQARSLHSLAFRGRVSDRVAEKLLDSGIDASERLLLMSNAEIAKIPGIGKAALQEIEAYRSKFLPK
jgi:DNA-directed RNA polymerase alpha subunit